MPFLRRPLQLLVLCFSLIAVIGSPARADLEIDRLMADQFDNDKDSNYGKLVFFVDVFDDQRRFVTDLERADPDELVTLTIDGEEIAGTVTIDTVRDANHPMAVAILVAAHSAYEPPSLDEEDGPAFSLLRPLKEGYGRFLRRLSNQNYAAVWYFNTNRLNGVSAWSNRPSEIADRINTLVKPAKDDEAPALYTHIRRVFEDIADQDTLPRRRVVLIVADGKSRILDKERQLRGQMDAIAQLSADTGAKLYAIGLSLDLKEPLVQLQELANKTRGVYREFPYDELEEADQDVNEALADYLENLARELENQYVITFEPKSYRGSETPVNMVLKLHPPGMMPMQKIVEDVRIPKMPFDWITILIKVGYGVGALLGLFLLFKLFKIILRARKNRPVYIEDDDDDYSGPYKGKLTCLAGEFAGVEFYLTEDLTTIGSIDGNTIVLQAPGISKRHAGIKIEDMRFELADFGSSNGTFVNGAKITKQFLRDGDEIRVADIQLKFSLK